MANVISRLGSDLNNEISEEEGATKTNCLLLFRISFLGYSLPLPPAVISNLRTSGWLNVVCELITNTNIQSEHRTVNERILFIFKFENYFLNLLGD